MSRSQREKGKRGERMLAAALTEAGFPARRGVQYHGGSDSADIHCPILARWHWEAKFVETARVRDWIAQVEGDAAGKPWVIAWKRSHGPWLALVKLDTLLDLIREALPPQTNLAPSPASHEADPAPEPAQKQTEPKGPQPT